MKAMTTLLETCRILPPPASADADLSLPLSFLDIVWLTFHPIRRLLFYEHPCSKTEFLEALVPKLQQSLSLTLKNYLPVAGNLLYPSDTDKKPIFRYVSGDSISLTIAETSHDFDHLVGNHARDSDQFYDLMPQMPPVKEEPEYKIVPLLALQVTLFPGRGICFGFANHHTLGDGSSMARFIWAWASVNKSDGDDDDVLSKNDESLPVFDRSLIEDPLGVDTIFWKVFRQIPFNPSSSFPIPTERVRATYILHRDDIQKLKNKVLTQKPGVGQVSSFMVTTSYIWSCLVKSGDASGEEADRSESEFFIFPVDARGRVEPPVPANYFGNCLGFGLVNADRKKIAGDDGFVAAAEAVAEEMKNRVMKKGELLKGAENWVSDMGKFQGVKILGVSGSPKFDLKKADFGWGKARKVEVLSLDGEKYSMSLCNASDGDGGLEVGLSLGKERMEAFAAIFADGLR